MTLEPVLALQSDLVTDQILLCVRELRHLKAA